MRWLVAALVCFVLSSAPSSYAQTLDNQGLLKQAIEKKYHPTQATADYTDVVTAGYVITLQKSGLVMYDVLKPESRSGNVAYRDGKLNAGGWTKMFLSGNHGPDSALPVRAFVSGEKCWLVGVTIRDDGLYLTFLSDSIQDVRYMGSIKFPVDKKQPFPAPEVLMAQVGEVISGAPLDQGQAPPPPVPAPAPGPPTQVAVQPTPAPAPPPPPPPPPDQPPPTIAVGQTRSTVLANFGQPLRVLKPSAVREIDYYADMKVTYVNGKVSDIAEVK